MGAGGLHLAGHASALWGTENAVAASRRPPLLPRLIGLSFVGLLAGQLARVPLATAGSKEAPLLVSDLLVVALLFAGLFEALRRRRFDLDDVAGGALLFVGIGAFSALFAAPRFGLSAFEAAFSLAYLARWTAYFGLYLLVINFVERERIEGIWRTLETMVVVFAVFGIAQSAFLPGFAQIV